MMREALFYVFYHVTAQYTPAPKQDPEFIDQP